MGLVPEASQARVAASLAGGGEAAALSNQSRPRTRRGFRGAIFFSSFLQTKIGHVIGCFREGLR